MENICFIFYTRICSYLYIDTINDTNFIDNVRQHIDKSLVKYIGFFSKEYSENNLPHVHVLLVVNKIDLNNLYDYLNVSHNKHYEDDVQFVKSENVLNVLIYIFKNINDSSIEYKDYMIKNLLKMNVDGVIDEFIKLNKCKDIPKNRLIKSKK